MKTSNKLILGFILGFFGLAIAIHLVLYSEYRKGHYVTAQQLHEEGYIRRSLPGSAPRVISIDGAIWVNLVSAREPAIDLPRKNDDPDAHVFLLKVGSSNPQAITYRQQNDTLYVTGNTTVTVHRPFSDWPYRAALPQVTIYSPSFDDVLLNKGQVYLQGAADSAMGRSARLTLTNSTLWIGMQYSPSRAAPREFFDSLDIRSVNSVVVLNAQSSIGRLQVRLRDTSELKDQYAHLTNPLIYCSPDSHAELSGDNLKKTKVIIQ